MSAGLTTHPHDVLEAVEAGATSAIDRLAVVCSEERINIQYVQFKQWSVYIQDIVFVFPHLLHRLAQQKVRPLSLRCLHQEEISSCAPHAFLQAKTVFRIVVSKPLKIVYSFSE